MKTLLLALLVLVAPSQQAAVVVVPDAESGVYEPGKNVVWTVTGPPGTKAAYSVKLGGLKEVAKGELELAEGKGTVTASRPDAGMLILEVKSGGKTVVGAAAFAPEKIKPSMPPPDDFDAFWKAKIDALKAVPANARLEKVDVGDPSIEY